MDPMFVVPFVKSVQTLFATMLQMPVSIGDPQLKTSGSTGHDVSGVIGMSGDVEGAVVLSFPRETAEAIATIFSGTPMTVGEHPDDFADAIGEMVNMVCGGAKAQFPAKAVSISCPSVIVGERHGVFGAKDVISIVIPCDCDCGSFAVEVSIRQTAGHGTAGKAVAAGA
jgi:chemotaxis protein CheX